MKAAAWGAFIGVIVVAMAFGLYNGMYALLRGMTWLVDKDMEWVGWVISVVLIVMSFAIAGFVYSRVEKDL